MANIFGEGFPDQIKNQITNRQKRYGSGNIGNRTANDISYLNSNTSWCKLVSGVDIDNLNILNNPTIKSLGLSKNDLAERFVLFDGTAANGGSKLREGITGNTSLLGGNDAYGIGGTGFGINPMMGIISATIKHENRGSLRRAQVNIKAFNKTQFEIIDSLYLRLGYSVLLEWGHAITINNSGTIDFDPTSLSLSKDFLNPGNKTYDDFLNLIQEKRLDSGGNYDAMFAKVTNFNWTFNKDGSYDIIVYLSSIGDVIESLKSNSSTNTIKVTPPNTTPQTTNQSELFDDDISGNIIDAFATNCTLFNFLYINKVLIDAGWVTKSPTNGTRGFSFNPGPTNIPNYQSTLSSLGVTNPFDHTKFEQSKEDCLRVEYLDLGGDDPSDKRYYLRLGTLLQFLQHYITPTLITKSTNKQKILQFDWGENTNLMNVYDYQVGIDPRICYVQRGVQAKSAGFRAFPIDTVFYFGQENPINPFINDTVTSPLKTKYDNSPSAYYYNGTPLFGPDEPTFMPYGNITNIFIDFVFIIKTVNDLKNDKGDLSLIDFLKGILSGLNTGMGGVNDFDVFIDETINSIKIIDKNPLNHLDEVIPILNSNFASEIKKFNGGKLLNDPNSTTGMFELYGYNGDQAGFISDFNLTSELSPAFSTMITAGAAARGTVVGENDTALSKLNRGLTDRFNESILNGGDTASFGTLTYAEARLDELDELQKQYVNNVFIKGYSYYSNSTGKTNSTQDYRTTEKIESVANHLNNIVQKRIEYDRAVDAYKGTTSSYSDTQNTGFLPFNLNFTLNGLSGIKINQQFLLDTNFLPTNYGDTLSFLIKGLSHEINSNKWVTKIETYSIPKTSKIIRRRSSTPPPPPPSGGSPTPSGNSSPVGAINSCGISTEYSHILPPPNNIDDRRKSDKGKWNLLGYWIRASAAEIASNRNASLIKSAKCHIQATTRDIYQTNSPPDKHGNIQRNWGNLGCMSAVSLIFYRATGMSIKSSTYTTAFDDDKGRFPGTKGTDSAWNHFVANPTFWKKIDNYLIDGLPGDIIITSGRYKIVNGKNVRVSGHVGVVIDTVNGDGSLNVISNGSSGFNHGVQDFGRIIRNYSLKGWDSVKKRNPSKTACFRYLGPYL